MLLFIGAMMASAQPPQVTQVIVEEQRVPDRRYPDNLRTTLTADCPQGKVRITYLDAYVKQQPRIQQLVVGGREYTRGQLHDAEALFGGLRVNYGSIADCGEGEDNRVRIHVSFMRPGLHAAERSTYVATIDVLADRVITHPRDSNYLHPQGVKPSR